MLDSDSFPRRQTQGKLGRDVLRMSIMQDQYIVPVNFIHRDKVIDGFLKRPAGLIVREIADVLADECLTLYRHRDCVLKICADREQRMIAGQGCDGGGGISARAAKDDGPETAC